MRLKTRIQLICFVMAAVVVTLSAAIMIVYISNSLKDDTENSVKAVNRQTLLALSNVVDSMDVSSRLPILDPDIYRILQMDYSIYPESMRRYYEYADRDLVEARLYSNIYYQYSYINSITIIPTNSNNIIFKQRNGYSPNIDGIKSQEWYLKAMATTQNTIVLPVMQDELYGHGRQIISIVRIIKDAASDRQLGLVKVDVLLSDLQGIWENALTVPNTQLIVADSDCAILYTTLDQTETDISKLLLHVKQSGENEMTLNGTNYLATLTQQESNGYQMMSLTPLQEINSGALPTVMWILVASLLCIAAAFVLAEAFSNHIMQPIRELSCRMMEVQKGDLSARASVTMGGEFGDVCRSFNSMVENTEQLVARIYEEENQKREAEYQALQAQISPHFLMNTLNAIKWMAFLQGSKSIESALNSLSAILRFAVKENSEKITIAEEMEQMNYYINILALRYPNRFVFRFDIQPETRDCLTLKYMIQPILENCVFHGLDDQEGGTIDVKVFMNGQDLLNYEVRDNGRGMSKERIKMVLNGETESSERGVNKIGIYNVNQRIKMVFGEAYGISIESVEGQYTLVRIIIPKEKKA